MVFSGGIRNALFGITPNLTKFPLIFFDGKVVPSNDSSHKVDAARIADVSCVLFHYKFLGRFHEQARRAVKEGNYYADSYEYRKYLETLEESSELKIKKETAEELESVNDLLGRFLFVSRDYIRWADSEDESYVLRLLHNDPQRMAKAVLERGRQIRTRDQRIWEHAERLREKDAEIRRLRQRLRALQGHQEQGRRPAVQVENLRRQLNSIQSSRTWRLMRLMHRLKSGLRQQGGDS